MQKVTILTWAVVLLVIMNVATITTIIYHNYNERRPADGVIINTSAASNPLNGRFFSQQLGFDETQMNEFRDANSHFRPAAFEITGEIDSLKGEMFTALHKTFPDSILLNRLSDEIGILHSKLKRETYQFYMRLKKVCTAQQLSELDKAFRPLFISDALPTPFNPGQRRGWRKENLNK